MLFREQRGGLEESLATQVELNNRAELLKHCENILGCVILGEALQIRPYSHNDRVFKNGSYIVIVQGVGVVGFTDGPCPPSSQWTDAERKETILTLLEEINPSPGNKVSNPHPQKVLDVTERIRLLILMPSEFLEDNRELILKGQA